MRTTELGLALIRQLEGLRLTAYQDAAGVWTIGFGHTGSNVRKGLSISKERADELLRLDVLGYELAVLKLVTRKLTDNQFMALVSFVFNVGAAKFATSTLLREVNGGNFSAAGEEFLKWDKLHLPDGSVKVDPGLFHRRTTERQLFLK